MLTVREMVYLHERRRALGGFIPERQACSERLEVPELSDKIFTTKPLLAGSDGGEGSTTFALGTIVRGLVRNKALGPRIVPIIPDEARTFGMEGLFSLCGIYSSKGSCDEPVDANNTMYYKEARNGQLLEEGNEAGAMSSFIAAGSAYANLGMNMVPFYVYYSMFGFQRIGDLIWCAADTRCKGFLCGGTSGVQRSMEKVCSTKTATVSLWRRLCPRCDRTPLTAMNWPSLLPDFVGCTRMEKKFSITCLSTTRITFILPFPIEVKLSKASSAACIASVPPTAVMSARLLQLFGSGTILREAVRAQQILKDKFDIGTDLWSVTSYSELRRDAMECQHWNDLHPGQASRRSFLEESLDNVTGPFISTSDNVRLVADQIREWIPGEYIILGTDGFGRSETRPELRRHFEIDGECTAYAALRGLARMGAFDAAKLPDALTVLGIDPEKINPLNA